MVKLYAFLGNHGREHRGNRHNVAWQFLENLPFFGSLRWERGFRGRWASRETDGGRIFYLCPETYMNLSGDSVAELMRFYKILPDELLAVHDELELMFGTISLKRGGGLGGHNGLRSIRDRLSTPDYLRFRFGIGRPDHDDVAGYVLQDFKGEERRRLEDCVFPKAAELLSEIERDGFDAAFAKNQKVNCLSEQELSSKVS